MEKPLLFIIELPSRAHGSACGRVRAEPDRAWDGVPTSDQAGRNVLTFLTAWSVLVIPFEAIFSSFFYLSFPSPDGSDSPPEKGVIIHIIVRIIPFCRNDFSGKNAIPCKITFFPRKIRIIPHLGLVFLQRTFWISLCFCHFPPDNPVFPGIFVGKRKFP